MRIAIALSVLLVALLVGGLLLLPRLIVWDDHRAALTEQVEALTGQLVAIQGRIDLELLPRPTLTLARTTLASRAAAPAEHALTVDRLDLRLEPLPLLAGRFEVDEIRLVRPVLQITPAEDVGSTLPALTGSGIMLPLAAGGPGRLSVVDGRAVVRAGDGAGSHEIRAINLELVADAANGPFALSGAFMVSGQSFDFRAQLGQVLPESWSTLQLEVSASVGATPASLRFRGLSWSDPGAPRLRGDLVLNAADARAGCAALARAFDLDLPQLPGWLAAELRLDGHVELAEDAAALDELQLALGEVEAEGELQLALGARPALDLRLDVPRLEAPEVLLPDGDGLALLAALAGTAAGEVNLSIGELVWRAAPIRRVRATLTLDGQGGMTVEQARAMLPGQSSLGFTGTLVGTGRAAALEGEATLVTSALGEALAWLGLRPPEVPEGRLRTLSLTSGLSLSDGALRFTDGELRVDASRFAGSLALSLGARTQIAAAVDLDRLNLDAYWPGGEVRELVDRALGAFRSFDLAVEARIERLTWHGVRMQDLLLDGRSVAGRLTVSELALHDLAGNQGHLAGELDLAGETFALTAELDTTRPAQLLRRLGLEPPLMLARLTPLRAAGSLEGSLESAELALELRHDAARLALAGTLDWAGEEPSYDLAVDASHPDYPALLDELGIAHSSPAEGTAALGMTGRLQGDLGSAVAVAGNARLGGMSLTGRVGWQRGPPRPRLTLQLSAGDPSAAALADLLAVAGLQIDPHLIEAPRPGAWSTAPLDPRWLTSFDAELELSAKGGVVGPGLELAGHLERGRLLIDRLAAALWGGRVEIQCSFDAWRPLPFMALALDLRAIDATALAAWLDLPPVIQGPGDLYAEVTAAGDDLRELIGSLIGEVRVSVAEGRLVGGAALAELQANAGVDGVDDDPLPLDGQPPGAPVGGLLGSALAAEPPPELALANLTGNFAVKRGIATTPGLPFELEDTPVRLEGVIDLLLWVADLRLKLAAAAAEDRPIEGLQLVGPLDRPQIRLLTRAAAGDP